MFLHKNDKHWIYNFSCGKNDMKTGSNLQRMSKTSVLVGARVQKYEEMIDRTREPKIYTKHGQLKLFIRIQYISKVRYTIYS